MVKCKDVFNIVRLMQQQKNFVYSISSLKQHGNE